MSYPRFSAFGALLAVAGSAAQDIFLLKSGDRITGTVLVRTNETVHVQTSAFGVLQIAENLIESISRKDTPPVGVSPPTSRPVVPPPGKRPSPAIKKKGGKSPWSGQVSAAISARESNTLRRRGSGTIEQERLIDDYRVKGHLLHTGVRDEFRWSAQYRLYRTDARTIDDLISIAQEYKRLFPQHGFFASSKSMYQQDYRRGIDHEFLQTAEIGINWLKHKKLKFSTSSGAAYHKYIRTVAASDVNGSASRDVELPKFVFSESFRWEMIDSLALLQKYDHQGDFSSYQLGFSVGLENRLVKNLFVRLEYKIEEDTEVSYDDRAYYNRSILTSFVFKF